MPLQKYFKLFFNTTFSRIHNRLAGSSTTASSLKHLTSPHTEIERKTARKMPLGHNDERRTNPGYASPISCVTFSKFVRHQLNGMNKLSLTHTLTPIQPCYQSYNLRPPHDR